MAGRRKYDGITSTEFHCLLICVGLLNTSSLVSALRLQCHYMTQNFVIPIGGIVPVCLSLERKGMLERNGTCMSITEKGIRTLSNFLGITINDRCGKMYD